MPRTAHDDDRRAVREVKRQSPWMLLSIVLHGSLAALLVAYMAFLATTLEERTPDDKRSSVTSAEKLEELTEVVREIKEEQLREQVEELEEILERMEELDRQKEQELREVFAEDLETAPQDAADEAESALSEAEAALELIEEALAQEQTQATNTVPKQDEAIQKQYEAETKLIEAMGRLELAQLDLKAVEDAMTEQVEAGKELAEARKAEAEAQAKQRSADSMDKDIGRKQSVADRAAEKYQGNKAEVRKRQDAFAEAEKQLETLEQRKDAGEARLAEANQKHAEAGDALKKASSEALKAHQAVTREQRSKTPDADAIKKAQAKKDEADKLEAQAAAAKEAAATDKNALADAVKNAIKEIGVLKRRVAAQERELAKREPKLDGQAEEAESAKAALDTTLAEQARRQEAADQAHEDAAEKLAAAADAQADAIAKVKAAAADVQAQKDGSAITAQTDAIRRPTTGDAKDLGDLYETAVEMERQIAERFKDIRAADTALVRDVSLGQAKQMVDVPVPQREAIDPEDLRQDARTDKAYNKTVEAMEKAQQQVSSMKAAASSMLSQAQSLQEEGMSITLEDRQANAQAEAAASHEVAGGKVSDLAELMFQQARASDMLARVQSVGSSSGDSARQAPQPGSIGPNSSGDVTGDQALPARAVAASHHPSPPPSEAEMALIQGSLGARKFAADGIPTAWAFVDSWYILGPFENPKRVNIHKQFPPESVLDLDAAYRTAATTDPVKWTFHQTHKPLVNTRDANASYTIWYAYTELHFEEAQDLWIAVGSDDRSDLWINDFRVWSSSDALKGWRVSEGLRRVHFKQGLNQVLYRIENGHHSWGFSMCIYTGGAGVTTTSPAKGD